MPTNCLECEDKFSYTKPCAEMRRKPSICKQCGGNGFVVIRRKGEPPDYHDCDACDCSGEVILDETRPDSI